LRVIVIFNGFAQVGGNIGGKCRGASDASDEGSNPFVQHCEHLTLSGGAWY
jgi:hypothetical protein